MTMRILAAIGLGAGFLLLAANQPEPEGPQPKVQVSKTEHIDFPSGGTLRFKNSVGVLTVEAWDQPGVEMTTIKSIKADVDARSREKAKQELDKVKVAAGRQGAEVVISTTFPGHRPFRPPYPVCGNTSFDLEYVIKAPANTRIVAAHTFGDVNIDGLVGDIQVTLAQGEILLHLPEEQNYAIHAKSGFGTVISDFPGEVKHRHWITGHRVDSGNSQGAHKLDLMVTNGDIYILRTRTPQATEPLAPASKADGL